MELEYKMMVQNDRCDVAILCNLIRKVCSGLTLVVVDDVVEMVLEALHNFLLNRGDNHDSLPKYVESSDHKFQVLKATGFGFFAPGIYDSCITELRNRKQENSAAYQDLMRWKNAPKGEDGKDDREPGITALNNAFRARMRIKRAGKNFEQFR